MTKYLIASLLSFMTIGLHAEDAQKLGSPAAVLDALQHRQGDVVLALIDGPADQSSQLKSLQGLLSVYSLELNGVDLGQVRRNVVLHVRPRLGLNKLIVRDAFKDTDQTELNFPAMRSAGVSTTIVEIQTSRQFSWIQALPLSRRDVQAIHDALDRSQHGGMSRVIDLIKYRGKEPILLQRKRPNRDESDDQSEKQFEERAKTAKAVKSIPSNSVKKSSGPSTKSKKKAKASSDHSSGSSSESTEKKSSVNISADRRSYY